MCYKEVDRKSGIHNNATAKKTTRIILCVQYIAFLRIRSLLQGLHRSVLCRIILLAKTLRPNFYLQNHEILCYPVPDHESWLGTG